MAYVRIEYPKAQFFTDDGVFAVGYWVWTYNAGLTTPVASYADRLGATPNSNPIVLDARGECDIYTNVALKLVFTVPDGDPSNPIWTVDYTGENEEDAVLRATITPGTTHNDYVATTTPTIAALQDEQTVIITPDVDSVATIGTMTFTGTGINDGVFGGPYVGTTSGAIFTVTIDGAAFQGSGLSDVTWGGTPLSGHVYTVKITTAAATDKFEWRKDAGAWSAEISMTGAAQTLTDGVTIKFAATTGHSVNDLWNNVDTFKWKIDAGTETTGVAITAAAQTLVQGVTITFAIKTGHVLGDIWAVPVETPVRLNLDSLGNKLVYKIIGGLQKALDAGDFKAGIPATLVWSAGQDAYILNNPSLPVLVEIQPSFIIHEINGDYTVSDVDARHFLNCSNTGTITLPACADFTNKDLWVASKDGTNITVNVAGGTDKIYLPFNPVGVTTIGVTTTGWDRVRFASNGAYWEVIEAITPKGGFASASVTNANWTSPDGVTVLKVTIAGAGGGGGGGASSSAGVGGGGGASGSYKTGLVVVTPRTVYPLTIGAGGIGGTPNGTAPTDGGTGGTTSLGALMSLAGGAGGHGGAGTGGGSDGAGGQPVDITGVAGNNASGATGGVGGKSAFLYAYASTWGTGGTGGNSNPGGPGTNGTDGTSGFILVEW